MTDTATQPDNPEVKGLRHPDMTPALALELLPHGALIPLDLLMALAELLNPLAYADAPARHLIAIADSLNASLDRSLKAAQQGTLSPGSERPQPPPHAVPPQPTNP